MSGIFAEIAVFNALDKTLHYQVPSELADKVSVGARVLVPLGRREATGLVLALEETAPDLPPGSRMRTIRTVLDRRPSVPRDLIELCRWISEYYFHPLGEVLQTALPSQLGESPRAFIRLTEAGEREGADQNGSDLRELLLQKRAISLADLREGAESRSRIDRELADLEARGLIERTFEWSHPRPGPKRVKNLLLVSAPEEKEFQKNEDLRGFIGMLERAGGPVPMRSVRHSLKNFDYWIRKLQRKGVLQVEETEELREFNCAQSILSGAPPDLTPDQEAVLEGILPLVRQPAFQPFVLFGVTGSGKTEVYLRIVEEELRHGRGSLVLVPEIALSSQMEAHFRQRFDSELAVWHSGLPPAARFDQWKEALDGRKRVVLGVRSAIFMPIPDLGVIIVDEEHDQSYKQDDRLRYHARDVAVMRARMLRIPVALASATPSLQSYHHAMSNRYTALSLPTRVMNRPLPEMEVVDMRREDRRHRILSHRLQEALGETIANNRQALLFLNRRGFAAFFVCSSCGHVPQCSHCSVSLTYHQQDDRLRCHYCGFETLVPSSCPACANGAMISHGFGTERVEEEVKRVLPEARVVRIDRDTASRPGRMIECLNALRSEKANVLIGTQMIAKGHDFPNITLVGAINADTALQLADFRAGEATVQILMQVSGRAGRGDTPGRVILQTYNPAHYTIESVMKMDYEGFCLKELESRKELQYPPYARMLKLLITAENENATERAAHLLADICRETADRLRRDDLHAAVLGPSPAPLVKIKKRFRWHIFVKAWTAQAMQRFIRSVLDRAKEISELRRVQIAVDRDPMMTL